MNKREPTKDECERWKKDKSINPITNYKIVNRRGIIYKSLEKACKDVKTPIASPIDLSKGIITKLFNGRPITKDICQKWVANKLINPYTNHLISDKSIIYKTLDNVCKNFDINPIDEIKDEDKIHHRKTKTLNPRHNLERKPTLEECKEWKKNKLRNPLSKTKGRIVKNGYIYKELEKECIGVPSPIMESPVRSKPTIKSESERITKTPHVVIAKKEKKMDMKNMDERFDEYYPELDDDEFNKKLLTLKEFNLYKVHKYDNINTINDFEQKAQELCRGFEKSSFQYLVAHYLSQRTPYRSLLLYYSVGVGKTCSAITIAEGLLLNQHDNTEPMVWVILPSAIEAGFKSQIFDIMKIEDLSMIENQCTGDTYVKLTQLSKELDMKNVEKRIKKIIKTRYAFFTYEGFATYIETHYISKNRFVNDKVIIVDEAHNIRSDGEEDDDNKRVYTALMHVCKTGTNNRLVLLTATPMYNEPTDIYNLLYLLLLNDKREDLFINQDIFDSSNQINPIAHKFIIKMSSNYISYLRGKNPFNFAFKLSPSLSGIKTLDKVIQYTTNGNKIDDSDMNWLSNVEDGIITAELGEKQIAYIQKERMDIDAGDKKNNFFSRQPMNIVYENSTGKEGFNSFFLRVGDKEQLILKYVSKYRNGLSPEIITKYSGKFRKLLDIIKKSNGIIIIYSNFIWSGILPVAIMLEHAGFTREGTNNLMEDVEISKEKVEYEHIKYPKYAILSSTNPEIMGNTTIDSLMQVINNKGNQNGEMVKVILMTPVAGEGLNFKNVREIHILDAWFHFNKINQIIGRGIRNCSHKELDIRDRNVTVFLYASINGYERETADIHAYRISSRKLYQTSVVDEIIRNSAIDCSLFKHINYFDKDMFPLGSIDIRTSQGVNIKYQLGDEERYKPRCMIDIDHIKDEKITGFREETYKHLGLNVRNKIKMFILERIRNNERFITYNELRNHFKLVHHKILMYGVKRSIYPNIIIDNILILPHQDGIHIIDVIKDSPKKIVLEREEKNDDDVMHDSIKDDFYRKVETTSQGDYINAIISLYTSLDENTFKTLITKIFQSKGLNKIDEFIENCFSKEGVLISIKELPNIQSTSLSGKYVGFVNIFNEDFEPLIYNADGINHKNLNDKQIQQLKQSRKEIVKPDDMSMEKQAWGMILPIYKDKDKRIKINVFKLLTSGVIYGKKTGIVCTSLKKKEHKKIIDELKLLDEKNTKDTYCNKIAIALYKVNRLSLLPVYKPII